MTQRMTHYGHDPLLDGAVREYDTALSVMETAMRKSLLPDLLRGDVELSR